MGLVQEFKEFAIKGNAIDLAVGAIIGAAFGKIVASLTDDLIMPPVGYLVGLGGKQAKNFADYFFSLDGEQYPSLAEAKKVGAPVLAVGSFLNTVLQFLILAFAVFLIVKAVNTLRRKPDPVPEVAPAPTKEEALLIEIRDLLATSVAPSTGVFTPTPVASPAPQERSV